MRHCLAALPVLLLAGPPAWLGADPPAASPPFPLWPVPREAGAHNADEYVETASILRTAEVHLAAALEWCGA